VKTRSPLQKQPPKASRVPRAPHVYESLLLAREGVAEPVQALEEAITRGGAGALDVPLAVGDGVQAELVGDLAHAHGVRQILLVGEHEKGGVAELVLTKHLLELFCGLADAITIVAVHHEDETLCVLEVVTPQRTDLVLSSDIPHGEADLLVLDSLHVEANGGDGGDDLAKLELVEDRGLTGGIETNHQDAHLLLAGEEFLEDVSHCVLCYE